MDKARNQEEARRAKVIAVEMYNAGDYNAAKEFAVKANTLDPELLGVRRLNAVLDVYMAHAKKINGEVDWYGILSADPSEDIETVLLARYNKLSSAIFSDCDDSIGGTVEVAKILMDAYRHIYDEKKEQVRERPEAQPPSRVRFENVDSPSGVTGPVNQSGMINGGERKRKEPLSTNELHAPQLRRISEDAEIRGDTHKLTPSLVQIALDDMETSLDMSVPASHQYMNIGASSSGTKTLQGEWEEEKKLKGINEEDLDMVDMSRNNIGAAAETFQDSNNGDGGERVTMKKEEEDPNVVDTSVPDHDLDNFDEDLMEGVQCNNVGAAAAETFQDSNNGDEWEGVEIFNEEYYDPYEVDMSVPDPDFYDFDQDRTEDSFQKNQVWALYDEYGMPRYYALVRKVVSREPFKLCISWLNSNKNDELGPMNWIESGFHKTSGNFSIGKRVEYDTLHSFSHRVELEKGAKALVHIYPKKGNVWALFKNWEPEWNLYTSLEEMNQYDMVEVLEDFDDDGGVTVRPLVKVAGLLTVFKRHQSRRTYPRGELFRFSHQVSFKLITGEEGLDAPEGCLELDPAAMSPDLLEVYTEEEMTEVENAMEIRAS